MTQSDKTSVKTAAYQDTIAVDRCFQALPNSDLIDWSILSYVVNLSKGGFVCVSYIAVQLGYTRESISRRLAKMEDNGWISRVRFGKRRMQVYLSNMTKKRVSQWKEDQQTKRIVKRCENKQKLKKQRQYNDEINEIFARNVKDKPEIETTHEQPETKPETNQEKHKRFTEHFRDFWINTHLPAHNLVDNIHDYLDYCKDKKARPSIGGCRRHLEKCAINDTYAIKAQPLMMQIKETAITKLQATLRKNELMIDIMDNMNFDMNRSNTNTMENIYEAA